MRKVILILLALAALSAAFWFGRQSPRTDPPTIQASESAASTQPGSQGGDEVPGGDESDVVTSQSPVSSRPEGAATTLTSAPESATSADVDDWMVTNGMLNEQAVRVLDSDDFARFVAKAKRDADANSYKATMGYRSIVEAGLTDQRGGPKVADFVCTNQLCLASIIGETSSADPAAWTRNIQESSSGTDWAISTMAQVERPLTGGRMETRLVFTTGNRPGGFIQRGPSR